MRTILIMISALTLTGCSSLLQAYADQANKEDPCQMKFKPEGYQKPNWCHFSQGRTVTVTRIYNDTYVIDRR